MSSPARSLTKSLHCIFAHDNATSQINSINAVSDVTSEPQTLSRIVLSSMTRKTVEHREDCHLLAISSNCTCGRRRLGGGARASPARAAICHDCR